MTRALTIRLAAIGLATLAGCVGDASDPEAPDLQPAPSGLQAPVPEAGPQDLAPPLVGTLVEAQAGDRACSLTLADDVGTEAVVLAAFELCEASERIGQRVRLTYEEATVIAESCGGDPACPATDTVLLAVAMEPAE